MLSTVVGEDGSNEVRYIGGAADLKHHLFAVEVIHSGFANEGVLNQGFGGCCMLLVSGGFDGSGFSAVDGPLWIIAIDSKMGGHGE